MHMGKSVSNLFTETLLYLSGGCMYRGVGVVVSAQFRKRIEHVSFHAYGPQVCVL